MAPRTLNSRRREVGSLEKKKNNAYMGNCVRGKNNKTHVFILPSRSREVLLLNVAHQQSYPSRDEKMSRDLLR